jgi:NAD(P)-dependent dehydrogenase (short-subunit alcohol dehydrogenase family)
VGHLEGKVAFVTGGSEGIGYATADRLRAEGATVFICGRREEELDLAAQALRRKGGNVRPLRLDIRDLAGFGAALHSAGSELGRLDILVNNAASYGINPIMTSSIEEWDDRFTTNVDATFVGTREALKIMTRQAFGTIVNVSSIYGVRAQGGMAAYSATKAAILQFTAVAAMEAAPFGIRINSVVPGIIDTPLVQKSLKAAGVPGLMEGIANGVPLRRLGVATEVANAINFLVSEEASYITGACLAVDGGKSVQFPTSNAVARAVE